MPERLTQLTIAPFDIGEPEQSASASFDSDGKEKKRRTKDRRKKNRAKRRGEGNSKQNQTKTSNSCLTEETEELLSGRNGATEPMNRFQAERESERKMEFIPQFQMNYLFN